MRARAQQSLVFWNDHQYGRLRWLARDGTPLTATFGPDAPLPADQQALFTGTVRFALVPLLDGSMVLSRDGVWLARYPRLATAAAECVPAWLASRPGSTVRFAMGNRS